MKVSEIRTRADFERAARDQNEAADLRVAEARVTASPCKVIDMLAFGGIPYCTAHRVMGPCPYGASTKGGAR